MAMMLFAWKAGLPLLLLLALLVGTAAPAEAKNCSDYDGVIDGNVWNGSDLPPSIQIDTDCTFQNFTLDNPLTSTINYHTNDPSIYLIVFDNVWFEGHLACANIPHRLWVVNSHEDAFSDTCQELMIPAETIDKLAPAATATVGEPFTYTLTLPSMDMPAGDPSPNDLHSVIIEDDLNATGADLTFVDYELAGLPGGVTYDFTHDGGQLTFDFGDSVIEAGNQLEFYITVVLDDTPNNEAGTQFVNTAEWQFGRLIEGDFYDPLPGESGVADSMTVVEPDFVVTKSSPGTAINLEDVATFTIDAHNVGGGAAWEVTVLDQFPLRQVVTGPDPNVNDTYAGMCEYDPTTEFTADIIASDGSTTVRGLIEGTDYTLDWTGYNGEDDACQLTFAMTPEGDAVESGQRLIITYQSQLDQDSTQDGAALTNVAGATDWFSADGTYDPPHARRHYQEVLTDGTPDIDDHEDSYTIYTALSGYYFQKTAANLTSGVYPAHAAVPGDTMRYRLRLFNVDQIIENLVISDVIDGEYFDLTTFDMVTIPDEEDSDFDQTTGELNIFYEEPRGINVGEEIVIEFDITLLSHLKDGEVVNQAEFSADVTDPEDPESGAARVTALSDDPYGPNGVAGPDDPRDPTVVAIRTPAALAKEISHDTDTVTIGEHFTYVISVPAEPAGVPLYNVRIHDDLSQSGVDLGFVDAEVISGGDWTISNAGTDTYPILEDAITGINIPADGRAEIEITVEVLNTTGNSSELEPFVNSAWYTFSRTYDGASEVEGGEGTSGAMTIVEPDLTMTKGVENISSPGDPAAGGHTLEYTLTIPNEGDAIAYDINIIDFLPGGLALVEGSGTARIDEGEEFSLLDPDPDAVDDPNTLIWGYASGDELQVPAAGVLEIKYQVMVEEITADTLTNSAWVDWKSLEGGYPQRRTGEGCPATFAPNDYCYGEAEAVIATQDTNAIAKALTDDTWGEDIETAADTTARAGDTVTYELALDLREGLTRNVSITDTLAPGLAFVEVVSINGDTEAPYSSGGVYTHDPIPVENVPAAGETGSLEWNLGDIEVTGSTEDDRFVIVYRARVQHGDTDDPEPAPTATVLNNGAILGYTYADGTPVEFDPQRLESGASVEVLQPEISVITKSGAVDGPFDPDTGGDGTEDQPYRVDIVDNSMDFSLEACNDGHGPAYGVVITDRLAPELDEGSIDRLIVRLAGEELADVDYTYEAPEQRGGTMRLSLGVDNPLAPGACLSIDYSIGFYTDLAPDLTWYNEAVVDQYWSRETLHENDAREYIAINPVAPSSIWMTNAFEPTAPTKELTSPASGEATIGEEVVYTITVPGEPVNAALNNVTISDTLDQSLEFVDATATMGGESLGIVAAQDGQNLSWTIDHIPAGEQAEITLTTRVANNEAAQAGHIAENTASYTYVVGDDTLAGGDSELVELRIVEPRVEVTKAYAPEDAAPIAGDLLTYTLTFDALAGEDYSDAFDLSIVDTLSVGLAYESGSAEVDGGQIDDPSISGDGLGDPQELVWDAATLALHIARGETVTVTYQVRVLESGPGQILSNQITGYWTSLAGEADGQRTGEDCPDGLNDYCTSDFTEVEVADHTRLSKLVALDSWDSDGSTADDATVRIGDTVTYHLNLELQEGITRAVSITDQLDQGLEFIGYEISSPSGAVFDYTLGQAPAAGDTGELLWDFGDIVNEPGTSAEPIDTLMIAYTVRVMSDAGIEHLSESILNNTANLDYLDVHGDEVPYDETRMETGAEVELKQPVIDVITKIDLDGANREGDGSQIDPYIINDITADTMEFQLEACNTGAAPAYGMVISDRLAEELDENSIGDLVVSIDGAGLADGDYSYHAPAGRGGEMRIELETPLDAGECVTVDYRIGFYTDIPANQIWSNEAAVEQYWSLPPPDAQEFSQEFVGLTAVAESRVWMSNAYDAVPPSKTLILPASGEATIGEEVEYSIMVPSEPVNAALDGVTVSDTLSPSLAYVDSTVTINDVIQDVDPVADGRELSWHIDHIPAGEQMEITLTVRVANNADTNAGGLVGNIVSYSHAGEDGETHHGGSGEAGELRIVEPRVELVKSVAPETVSVAGDTVTYTLSFSAGSGADLSDAFDITIEDTLDIGLAYVPGSAAVAGGNTIGEPLIDGDGVDTPQTLSWGANEVAIDIPAGDTVAVSYQVRVLDNAGPGWELSNRATGFWTSLAGDHDHERTGADCPDGVNDYCTTDTAVFTVEDHTTLAKSHHGDSWNDDGNVRVGEFVEYELRLGLQQGTHTDLVLSDTLPDGMVFEAMVSADYFGTTQTPPEPDIVDGQTLIWELGTVSNPDDSTTDELVIVYRARVLNESALSQEPVSQELVNQATLDYTVGGEPAAQLTATETITVLQPLLAVTKSSDPVDGSFISAGETITYTVEITNSGAAPAYDPVLVDTLPQGLRQGGVTTESITLVNAGTVLPVLDPAYDPDTGITVWDFDSGIAGEYTIDSGETLRVVYQVSADADLGTGLELTNTALVEFYYSFDSDRVPENGEVEQRQVYGPTGQSQTTLHTARADALNKAITQDTAAIGEQFSYVITVPEIPLATAIHEVLVMDDLSASTADLRFVTAHLEGEELTNSGTDTYVELGADGGINIPAHEQVDIEITVELLATDTNLSLTENFINSAWYSYSNGEDRLGDEDETGGISGPMTLVHPELTVEKSGPASMRVGEPDTFTLEVHNPSGAEAWNPTLTDRLPNPSPGGMCDTLPEVTSAVIYRADDSQVTLAAADYLVDYVEGEPTCEFTVTLTGDEAVIGPGEHLVLTYQVELDADNIHGSILTNVAGATQWYSSGSASNERQAYLRELTDGTPEVLDHEDAHEVLVEAAILEAEKTAYNLTTGESGEHASPGDELRYTITIENTSEVPLNDFTLVDELDALNDLPMFEAGSLSNISLPPGASSAGSDPDGGAAGTGRLEISGLDIAAYQTLTIEFEAALVPVITSGTVVLNQGELVLGGTVFGLTDDPAADGEEAPTETLISSAPVFEVWKSSESLDGNPEVVLPGDTLRYTITVKNIGSEDAEDVELRDHVPANTTYVANSTHLNGELVEDHEEGMSPLQEGMPIHTPEDTTPGLMPADDGDTAGKVATITFEVVVHSDVIDGTIISNQGFVNGSGLGSGPVDERPSGDPATPPPDDPTLDVVGELPLIRAHKTVAIVEDYGSPGIVDPGDVLRYTIRIDNFASVTATDVEFTDQTPEHTTYVPDSVTLNGQPVGRPDGGVSPLIQGITIQSEDQQEGSGILPGRSYATVTFDVRVDDGVEPGTIISNQGYVASGELATEPTDADGNPATGHLPTEVVVGEVQHLQITKNVLVVGGGSAEAGGVLEYVVRINNIGSLPATGVMITDDLAPPLADLVSYVEGSAILNGSPAGISFDGSVLVADYAGVHGQLPVDGTAELRFRVRIDETLEIGTRIDNTAEVSWNDPVQTDAAHVFIDVGGDPGQVNLSGRVWHDVNFNKAYEDGEHPLADWTVEIYRSGQRLGMTETGADGNYRFSGLNPNDESGDAYELRFIAASTGPDAPGLGWADSPFVDGMHEISEIIAAGGSNLQNLNLPVNPNGVVYDSVHRTPVSGVTMVMIRAATDTVLPANCFDDPAQQNQVTGSDGFYRFDLNFSDPSCPSGDDYLIRMADLPADYSVAPSMVIPPQTDEETPAFSVPDCAGGPDDAVPATTEYCEVQPWEYAPSTAVEPHSPETSYYLHLTLDNGYVPGDSQLFHNHIPVDPELDGVVAITKTASLLNVSKGQLVPYTITVSNILGVPLYHLGIIDRIPAGFKYVEGSARLDGEPLEPGVEGLELFWDELALMPNEKHELKLLLVVGAGVSEGEYVNRALAVDTATGKYLSGEATATVRVVPDPTFDCTDIVGKVFDDRNMSGRQDTGDKGLAGVRVVTARGLVATTDEHGRFHITCAAVPDQDRGSNFILKVDDRTLPTGYRLTTENPRVQRATRGKMMRFNFGATIHRVVGLEIADGVFEPETTEMRPQWESRIDLLIEQLEKEPSVLRLSYLADTESRRLVQSRLDALKREITSQWQESAGDYRLTIETEVFWRRGGPPEQSSGWFPFRW